MAITKVAAWYRKWLKRISRMEDLDEVGSMPLELPHDITKQAMATTEQEQPAQSNYHEQ